MSAAIVDLSDVFGFCATEQSALSDVWAEIERTLCNRDKNKPPRILIDMRRTLFRQHGFDIEVFVECLSQGVWADTINDGGRLAIVIGTQEDVCVCGKLELLDALAEVSDRSDAIRIMSTTEQAVRWLNGGRRKKGSVSPFAVAE